MNLQEILDLHEKEIRIAFDDPDLVKEELANVVRLVRAAPGMGFIRHSRLDESNVDAEIQAQQAYFAGRDLPFEWDVYAYDRPADLEQRLLAHGFVPDLDPDDPGAVLVLDVNEAFAQHLKPVSADCRQITTQAGLADVASILSRVYGRNFDWLTSRLAAHMEIDGYLSVYAAYVNDEPACCAWTYYYPRSKFAILRGGSTVPEQRGRGLYTALLAARIQAAISRDYRYLTVDASPMSRPILEKQGFQLLTYSRSYKWQRGQA